MPAIRARCLKCRRCFRRLDTHLRVSATCCEVAGLQTASPSPTMNVISSIAESSSVPSSASIANNSNFCATQPGNLHSAVSTTTETSSSNKSFASDQSLSQHPFSHSFTPKARLHLPTTSDNWKTANDHFEHHLVPAVLDEVFLERKNAVLAEGIFNYFANNYGSATRNQHHKVRQNKKLSRCLPRQDVLSTI